NPNPDPDDPNPGPDDDDDDDNTGGGGGAGADKITHGPYEIGDWYNDGTNEGWVYMVWHDGEYGEGERVAIMSEQFATIPPSDLITGEFDLDIPENWTLMSSFSFVLKNGDPWWSNDLNCYVYGIGPEYRAFVKKMFHISTYNNYRAYYASQDGTTIFYQEGDKLGLISHPEYVIISDFWDYSDGVYYIHLEYMYTLRI
ncbi:MAG: hypothetical protein Q4F45_05020, partial [Alistipes sp.]|nr:hypothetical protein [Alistipes sp.]